MMRSALLFLLCLCISLPCLARTDFEFETFSALPVLHEGRIKPLDSFARIELRKIHGTERFAGLSAPAWLARALFDPAAAAQDKIFTIRDPQVRQQLGLGGTDDKRFSLNDIGPGLEKTAGMIPALMQSEAKLTPPQKALLEIHESALTLTQLMGAFTMIFSLDGDATWLDLRKDQAAITDKVKAIAAAKGKDPEKYSDQEKQLTLTAMQMEMLGGAGASNILFRIMPPQWGKDDEWRSPWITLLGGGGAPAGAAYMRQWENMAAAWRKDDAALWAESTQQAATLIQTQISPGRIRLETGFNALKPLALAEHFYGLALLVLLVALWRQNTLCYRLALGAGAVAGLLHLGAIVIRSILLERPPVGTLYESLIFVSLTIFAAAIIIELFRRDRMALAGGLGATLVLLYVAPVFAPAGDSLEMLVAVLNTGFWLSTHVLCITIGYGVSIMAATIAHFALLRQDSKLDGVLHKTLICALFFTAFGTMLGGIWADQSWGRFWGWDPKENGALLIVVWIAWILHGKYSGHLRGTTYHIAAAYLNVIVALAWFGVNLLNVGLHSYGFTGEMAMGLGLFCAFETALMVLAYRKRGAS